jgi:1-acyl-sn-glycerol-3-phosphate acyltransferase
VLTPLLCLSVQKTAWLPYHQRLLRFWAETFCRLAGIHIELINQHYFSADETYVFCGNHFSSFDNLTISLLLKQPFTVIGLVKTTHLPIYGYLFRKTHIIINRKCNKSKRRAFWEALRILKEGRSMIISPEGGIRSLNPPQIYYPFEDGAFVLAIKSQRPIVPFTLHTNYKILPEFPLRFIHRHPMVAEFHEPISTIGLTMGDVQNLKEKTYRTIQAALYHPPGQLTTMNTRKHEIINTD